MLSSQEIYFNRTKILERRSTVIVSYCFDNETKRLLDNIYDDMVINFE